jgi:serine/threonine-protein kinase
LPTLAPGDVVASRFEILSLLGTGGMGVVFKAHDRTLDEIVALKTLRADLASDELSTRFRSEIRLARKVSTRHVCRIHEYGESDDLRYISMEFVDGVTLKDLLQQSGALPLEQGFEVAHQIIAGVKSIHDAGIMHRDLKSPNIMRTRSGLIKLMDFGIAKQVGGVTLTAAGQALGTPEYMSPEQVMGQKLDYRTDIYTLGIVLYELFTGTVPFRADSPVATARKQVMEPPNLDVRGIPTALGPVLRRALAKDRDHRFPTALELGVALHHVRQGLRLAAGRAPGAVAPPPQPLHTAPAPAAPARDTGRPPAGAAIGSVIGSAPHASPSVPGRAAEARPPAHDGSTAAPPGAPRAPSREQPVPPPAAPPATRSRPSTGQSLAMAPPEFSTLVESLRGPDPVQRRKAVLALADLAPRTPAAVRPLIDALSDRDDRVRWMAAAAMGRIGPAAAEAVAALIDSLDDEVVGGQAAESLVKIGRAAVPALMELLQSGAPSQRLHAANALTRIGAGG